MVGDTPGSLGRYKHKTTLEFYPWVQKIPNKQTNKNSTPHKNTFLLKIIKHSKKQSAMKKS